MSKGTRFSGKQSGARGPVKRVRRTPPGQGKERATVSWTPLSTQKQNTAPQLEVQACQASKLPRPCIKKFLAELQWKIANTPASTYHQPRKRRRLPSAHHSVYTFWDCHCFLTPLADCQDGLRGQEFLDSHIFHDWAQPDDDLYVLELLHSIAYASAAKLQQGKPHVAPHALELLRRAPVDLPEHNPKGPQTPAAPLATNQKQPALAPATPVPTTQTPCTHVESHPHEHPDPQAQSCKILDPFANQSLEAAPDEDFLELLSENWKEIQEDPERAARQRGFDEAFIANACDLKEFHVEVVPVPPAKKPAQTRVEEGPDERLDDDFLAEIFASAEKEVAPPPQLPATPTIHPLLKELPAGVSPHMYFMELSATPTLLESGTAASASVQQKDSPYINQDVLDAMDFQCDTDEMGASTQQQDGPCIDLSVQDAEDLVADLVPGKYKPQVIQPPTSERTLSFSDIEPLRLHPPVIEEPEPLPAKHPGPPQPAAACCHPGITPPLAGPAKRAKRRTTRAAPSVDLSQVAPLDDILAVAPPQKCTPVVVAGSVNEGPRQAAAPAVVPRKEAQACAKRKAAVAAKRAAAEDVPTPPKRPRVLPAELPGEEHEGALHPRELGVKRGKRSLQARQRQVCLPRVVSMADEAWRNLLVV